MIRRFSLAGEEGPMLLPKPGGTFSHLLLCSAHAIGSARWHGIVFLKGLLCHPCFGTPLVPLAVSVTTLPYWKAPSRWARNVNTSVPRPGAEGGCERFRRRRA